MSEPPRFRDGDRRRRRSGSPRRHDPAGAGLERPGHPDRRGSRMPYERPPLSKAVMVAEADPTAPPSSWMKRGCWTPTSPIWRGRTVVSIDRDRHCVILGDGREFPTGNCCWRQGPRPANWHCREPRRRTCFICGSSPTRCLAFQAVARRPAGGHRRRLHRAGDRGQRRRALSARHLIEMAPRLLMRGVPAPSRRTRRQAP